MESKNGAEPQACRQGSWMTRTLRSVVEGTVALRINFVLEIVKIHEHDCRRPPYYARHLFRDLSGRCTR